MNNLEIKLKEAQNLIENKYIFSKDYYYRFRQIYPFTTENLKDKYQFFDLNGKEVLTVQGSGDQLLELLLNGAINIDTFDINPLTELYTDLKIAAFKSQITKKEYLDFFRYNDYPKFGTDNNKCFNQEIFNKIKKNLNQESYEFWNQLFSIYNHKQIRRKDYLFSIDEARDAVFEKILSYYQEENFERLYQMVEKLNNNFIESDIRNLPKVLTKQYDFIDLSNIIRYAEKMYDSNPLENYYKLITQIIPFLKPNGNLIVGYLYQLENEYSLFQFYKKELRDLYFDTPQYQYYSFDGIYDIKYNPKKKYNDAVLVYHKK